MILTADHVKDHAHIITKLANDKKVYADLMQMPLAFNVGRNPHLLNLVEEALKSHKLTAPTIRLECDMGRTVGYGELAVTKDSDAVFYAQQTKLGGFTRFVKNHRADATQYITICLQRDDEGDYKLENVWLGKSFPAAPGESDETPESRDFWTTHAVIFNGQPLIASTLTKDCPY